MMLHRHLRTQDIGFTLIELLVAILITGLLLGGLSVVINHLRTGTGHSPWHHFEARYEQAIDVVRADIRGLIAIEPMPAERTQYGEPLARFRSTHRLEAIQEGRWAGATRVSYWLQEEAEGSRSLWRSEAAPLGGIQDESWSLLLSGLESFACHTLEDGAWVTWPDDRVDNQANAPADGQVYASTATAVRIQAVEAATAMTRARPLPDVLLIRPGGGL